MQKEHKNVSGVPDHEIEAIARCLYPDILAFYKSEEGKQTYERWKVTKKMNINGKEDNDEDTIL